MAGDSSQLPERLRKYLDGLDQDGRLDELAEHGALGEELAKADEFSYAELTRRLEESIRRVQDSGVRRPPATRNKRASA